MSKSLKKFILCFCIAEKCSSEGFLGRQLQVIMQKCHYILFWYLPHYTGMGKMIDLFLPLIYSFGLSIGKFRGVDCFVHVCFKPHFPLNEKAKRKSPFMIGEEHKFLLGPGMKTIFIFFHLTLTHISSHTLTQFHTTELFQCGKIK